MPTREQNRKNAKKNYEKNQYAINRKRVLTQLGKGVNVSQKTLQKYSISQDEVPDITMTLKLEQLNSLLQKMVDETTQKKENNPTYKGLSQKYKDGLIKTLARVWEENGCDADTDVLKCFSDPKISQFILNKFSDTSVSEKSPEGKGKISSGITYIKNLLYIVDHIPSVGKNVNVQHMRDALEKIKPIADEYNLNRQQVPVESMSSILKRAKDDFGEDSEEHLLVLLYEIITLRNDFDDVILFEKKPKEPTPEKYIILSSGRLVMKSFNKTDNKHSPVDKILPDSFIKLLKKSLKDTPRNTLLSVQANTLLLRMDTGINKIRKGNTSEKLQGKMDDAKLRVELASNTKHSITAQAMSYVRPLLADTPPITYNTVETQTDLSMLDMDKILKNYYRGV